jgi:hypothetical protein
VAPEETVGVSPETGESYKAVFAPVGNSPSESPVAIAGDDHAHR